MAVYPALALERLTAGYGARAVLHDVSLEVATGAIVGLIGPNGSGKSTIVRAITRIVALRGGTIRLFGRDIAGLSAVALAREVAVVPQAAALPGEFTGLELALLGRTPHLRLLQSESAADVAIAREALARCDALHLAGRCVGEMSGGERQRLLIARALTQQPRLLLLDEPTAYLDLVHQAAIFDLVAARRHADGLTVLVVVHDLTLAAQYCDRLVLLGEGRVLAQGSPAGVLRADLLSAAYGGRVTVFDHPESGLPVVLPAAAAATTRYSATGEGDPPITGGAGGTLDAGAASAIPGAPAGGRG